MRAVTAAQTPASYTAGVSRKPRGNRQHAGGIMKFLKYAAFLAIAAIPLVLGRRRERKPAEVVESDHIFDLELSSD